MQVKTTVLLSGVGGFTVRKGTRLTVDDSPDNGGLYRVSRGKYQGLRVAGEHLINVETHQYVGATDGQL
jgi:hypothetical protein